VEGLRDYGDVDELLPEVLGFAALELESPELPLDPLDPLDPSDPELAAVDGDEVVEGFDGAVELPEDEPAARESVR
jgi:hypothetical protein